jgi:DNA polymerase I-like protein with 3'-5' exonuclease and polymerase domains
MQLQVMDDRVSIVRPWFKDYRFHLVQDIAQLKKLVDMCITRQLCSLDIETTGVDNRIYPDEYFEDGRTTRHGIRTVDRIAGVCLSFDGLHGYYIPLSHEPEDAGNLPWDEAWDEFTRLINGAKCVFHNAKFDQEFLYPVTGREYWKLSEFEDTFLLAKVLNPLKGVPAGLKPLSKLNYEIEMVDIDELFTQEKKDQLKREKRGPNFALLHPKEGVEYGCSDGIFTYKLWFTLKERFAGNDSHIYDLEKSFSNVLRKMERNRVHIDVDRVQQLNIECQNEIIKVGDIVRDIIEKKTGQTGKWKTLNVGSPKQLSQALITDPEGLRLKPTPEMVGSEETGWRGSDDDDDDDDDEIDEEKQYTLKDEALKSLHRVYRAKYSVQREGVVDKDGKPKPESIFDLIIEYRHYDKMKGSYVDKLFKSHDRYGDVRPSFNQMGTDTARLSSKAGKIQDGYSGVNFQGIPRDSDEDKPELFKQIRTCIIPRPGYVLVKLDFAGEELRVVTNLSGDPIWTKSFLFEDGDVHSITSRTLFGKTDVNKDERNRGKRCNFAFIYGGGAGAIQRNIGCSIEDAQRHMDNLKRDVPVLMGYVDEQKRFARKHKCIYTAFGRRLPIPTIDSPIRAIRSKAERCAINYTIQATSADILKYAMCLVDKKIRQFNWEDRVRYVLTVHDEIVYEVKPEYLMEIVRKLDEWMTFPWTLEKAHGRKWVVPLLTEPGIDVNWKARYDYFKMVDGIPLRASELDGDGEYKGKLKKDEYIESNRLYQRIPEFLRETIHVLAAEQPKALPETTPEPVALKPHLESEPTLPEPPVESPKPPEPPPVQEPVKMEPQPEVKSTNGSSSISMDDFDLDIDIPPVSLNSDAPNNEISFAETPAIQNPSPSIPSHPEPENTDLSAQKDTIILRWELRATPSVSTMRKLTAVCVLAEGKTPLRIVNNKGEVIMNESEGILVEPSEFKLLTRLFGL